MSVSSMACCAMYPTVVPPIENWESQHEVIHSLVTALVNTYVAGSSCSL